MIKLKCNECGKIHERDDSELDYEPVGSDSDRQMGIEFEYSGVIEIDCDGENCENHIEVEFNFWEYPAMALNYSEYNEEGCIVIDEPDYQRYLTHKNTDENEE